MAYDPPVDHNDDPYWPGSPPRPCAAKAGRSEVSGLRVPFAACGDGVVLHVEQVRSSRQGPFTCIGCNERLTFKRGVKMRQHFAHRSDSKCSGETALHLYAKLLLAVAKRITLPPLMLSDQGIQEFVCRREEIVLDTVVLESPKSDFQPDAMITAKGVSRAIEFKVFHAVDDVKRNKVVRADCPMVEIDLSAIPWRKLDGDGLDRQILHEAPRHWIHHPDRAGAQVRLEARVVADRKKRGGRLRWHILERRQEPKIDYAWVEEVRADLASAKLDGFVGRPSKFGHWFTVPPILWQAGLLHELLYRPSIIATPGVEMRLAGKWSANRRLSSVLPDWMIRNDLSNYKKPQLEAAGFTTESFATAEWAAIDYLWGLACDEQMFLFRKEDQSFHVSPDIHRRIYNRHRLEVSVRQILEAANDPDAEANSRTWMRHHLIGGRIPWTIAGEGGDDFKQLRNRIDAILKMTRTYAEAPIVDDLCGLAVEEWRDELVRQRDERDAKARQKLDEVMEARKRRLRDLATRALKEEASGWLESQSVGDIPLLDWASESDDRYWKGFELIGRAENARKTRILAAEAADDIRKRLTAASNTAFRDPARSHLFLHSAHPKLAGRRPIEACSTEADLRIALALLPKN